MKVPSFYGLIFANNSLPFCWYKPAIPHFINLNTAISFVQKMGIGFIFLISYNQANAEIYSLNQLKKDVVSFLSADYQQVPHERLDISLGNLDRRLTLEKCDQTLVMTTQDQSKTGGNISVQVQCKSKRFWSVHIPAQVFIYREVPLAGRELSRGDIIGSADLSSGTINISEIRQAFLTDSEAIVGKQVKRTIAQGDVFKGPSLDEPRVIKRGDTVTLEIKMGQIQVNSAATAMSDGRIGQRIRVRNNQSSRVITGVVVREGLVQTL